MEPVGGGRGNVTPETCRLNYSIWLYGEESLYLFIHSFILLLPSLHSTKSPTAAGGGAGGNRKWTLSAVVPADTSIETGSGSSVRLPGSSAQDDPGAPWGYQFP